MSAPQDQTCAQARRRTENVPSRLKRTALQLKTPRTLALAAAAVVAVVGLGAAVGIASHTSRVLDFPGGPAQADTPPL